MIKLSILTPVWNQEELVIKGLNSIPRREDVEVIVCNDGSTDGTLAALKEYAKTTDLNLTVLSNSKNKGVAATANRLLASAKGEWFHFLMSDDYLYTDKYNALIDSLYGKNGEADVVCMDLIENSGAEYVIDGEKSGDYYCAQACRFIRKAFVDGIKYPESKLVGEDADFHAELKARNPKIVYTKIAAYHYNYPRVGSLIYKHLRGEI